jgi:hypothetical protein
MFTERGRAAEPKELEALPVDGPTQDPPRRHPVAVAAVVMGVVAVLVSGARVGVVERRDRQLRKLAGFQRTALQDLYNLNTTTTTTSTIPWDVDRPVVNLEFTAAGHVPTCAEGAASGDPATLLEAFRAARVQGRGAEECLTASGRRAYARRSCTGAEDVQSHLGAVPLYRCGPYVVASIAVSMQGYQNADSSIDASLDVTLVRLPPGDPAQVGVLVFPEGLTVTPAKVKGGPVLISDASNDTGGG